MMRKKSNQAKLVKMDAAWTAADERPKETPDQKYDRLRQEWMRKRGKLPETLLRRNVTCHAEINGRMERVQILEFDKETRTAQVKEDRPQYNGKLYYIEADNLLKGY